MVIFRGSKILTCKISTAAPIWAPKIIFLGEFECFLSYLSIRRPKNSFLPPKKFESHRVSLSLNFETRQLVFLGLMRWLFVFDVILVT